MGFEKPYSVTLQICFKVETEIGYLAMFCLSLLW